MRELKFRAYIKPLKRYATGLDTIQFHKCCDVAGAGIWTVVTVNEGIFECDDIIIEQYTGLKDKNGKEIYEGDIVLLTDYSQEVAGVMCCLKTDIRWDEEYCGFILGCTKMGNKLLLWSRNDYIVIGNIHENPELLEAIDK